VSGRRTHAAGPPFAHPGVGSLTSALSLPVLSLPVLSLPVLSLPVLCRSTGSDR